MQTHSSLREAVEIGSGQLMRKVNVCFCETVEIGLCNKVDSIHKGVEDICLLLITHLI
ncbi:hypothetical protein AAZX31_17G020600 [Glycine max]